MAMKSFNSSPRKGFRIGIDASIWFFHAEYGKEGENPQLRTLFFRCATLLHSPFLPLFVFDGPLRPAFKRNKRINASSQNSLVNGLKGIIEAFGFHHATAPGEAEAELAYLNRIGMIDGILSDDVDNFLFGAECVIRNSSNTLSGNASKPILNSAGKDDKNHVRVFSTSSPDFPLTQGDLIFLGLLCGGDYDTSGLEGCGMKTGRALCRAGFGRSLYEAAQSLSPERMKDFLTGWREEIRVYVATDPDKYIGSKKKALSKSIPNTFPDLDVLYAYVDPITSASKGKRPQKHYRHLTWDKEPSLPMLAAACERHFEWGFKERIVYRFRTVIWTGIVMRILRRAALLEIEGMTSEDVSSSLILKYFADGHDIEEGEEDEALLGTKIFSSRRHASTDKLLEFRISINPAILVRLTEFGVLGIRPIPPENEWEEDDDDDDESSDGDDKKKKEPIKPQDPLRIWIPADILRLTEPELVEKFVEAQRLKEEKKANKGKGRPKKETLTPKTASTKKAKGKQKQVEEELSGTDLEATPKKKPMKKSYWSDSEEDDSLPIPTRPKPRGKAATSRSVTKSVIKPVIEPIPMVPSDDDDACAIPFAFECPPRSQETRKKPPQTNSSISPPALDPFPMDPFLDSGPSSSSPKPRTKPRRILSSDEDDEALRIRKVHKSPRKSRDQTSPRIGENEDTENGVFKSAKFLPTNPFTTSASQSSSIPVIDISSSEDDLPERPVLKTITASVKSRAATTISAPKAYPLLVARARKTGSSNSASTTSSSLNKPKPKAVQSQLGFATVTKSRPTARAIKAVPSDDIIDLT